MRRRPSFRFGWLVASVLILTTLTVPASWFAIPHVERWVLIGRLDSPDLKRREKALNFVLRHAADDRRVRAGAVRKLDVLSEENFLQIMTVLDRGRLWQRDIVGIDPWLRWLELAVRDDSAESRSLACQRIADLDDLGEDPRVIEMIRQLASDTDADVRYNALATAAQLLGANPDRAAVSSGPLAQVVTRLTRDDQPIVARHAWLLYGLLTSPQKLEPDWRDQPLPVAQAMIWAFGHAHPQDPGPAIDALEDGSADPALRSIAVYALRVCPGPEARAALVRRLSETPPQAVDDKTGILLWRTVLALRSPDPVLEAENLKLLKQWGQTAMEMDFSHWQIPVAISYRVHRPWAFVANPPAGTYLPKDDLSLLAALEGLSPRLWNIPINDDTNDLIRLAAIRATRRPLPGDLEPLLRSAEPAMRDLACVAAAERFDAEQNLELVTKLLKSFDNHAKMSGVILAGLTGSRPQARVKHQDTPIDLLEYVSTYPDWKLTQMVRLADWMQSRHPENDMTTTALALLSREDLPLSTILLAMLHRGRPEALNHLFAPRGEADLEFLIQLLVRERWWHVLSRYLPEDAPPLDLWGDPALQHFQLEVFREWCLLNRHREGLSR